MRTTSHTRSAAFALAAFVAPVFVLALAGSALTDDGAGHGVCPVEQKVSALLADWRSALDEATAMTPAARERLAASIASVKGSCPVGSRLGVTLAAVKDALGIVVAADEANAAAGCPLEKLAAERSAAGDTACVASCAELKALMAGRARALRQLHALAVNAAGFVSGACCAAGEKTAEVTPAVPAPAAAAACDAAATSACPIRVATRLGALQASWDAALGEATALSAEAKGRLVDTVSSIASQSKAVALVPASVLALADGFDALEIAHGKAAAWADANPDLAKAIPAELHRCFQTQRALLDETRRVLSRVRRTMATVNPDGCAAKDTVKTSVDVAPKS